jgi:hypothetical protein
MQLKKDSLFIFSFLSFEDSKVWCGGRVLIGLVKELENGETNFDYQEEKVCG